MSNLSADHLGFLVSWLDAMRRRDLEAVAEHFDAGVMWQGVPADAVCRGREQVLEMLQARAQHQPEAYALELIAAEGAVVLGVRSRELRHVGEVALPGQLFNVFRLREGRIVAVTDYARRAEALAAAAAAEPAWE